MILDIAPPPTHTHTLSLNRGCYCHGNHSLYDYSLHRIMGTNPSPPPSISLLVSLLLLLFCSKNGPFLHRPPQQITSHPPALLFSTLCSSPTVNLSYIVHNPGIYTVLTSRTLAGAPAKDGTAICTSMEVIFLLKPVKAEFLAFQTPYRHVHIEHYPINTSAIFLTTHYKGSQFTS